MSYIVIIRQSKAAFCNSFFYNKPKSFCEVCNMGPFKLSKTALAGEKWFNNPAES